MSKNQGEDEGGLKMIGNLKTQTVVILTLSNIDTKKRTK